MVTEYLSARAEVPWDETKPEGPSQLLKGYQPAPESPATAERTLASGHQLYHSGICPCCPMLDRGTRALEAVELTLWSGLLFK